ncbi:hypothetical protein HYPBUDRAFT_106953 [Hyphopichia burtonii NRRL Y-1933]|uniref:Aprataxin C2HE/C2H2/C2HC zinc finger domain-containing protein n=1 Tax=Hyphopichia burtonii NRRL Y-1933 TaxID=984485 RepID=A0A1E4RK81_9ASCO|nr:hypothetical protein HYPBUDRAFT_106953 [Hyphopichia burtonii NRRL Y-1933]ODV67646.1 hypothetical protein HYPBUDRAFT_106953 [Hyphopichia burtonii NRRL Y-1933]
MSFRFALQEYIDDPLKHPDTVLYHTEDAVIIKDKFPKSIRHYLVLPRGRSISFEHPLEVFQLHPELYKQMEEYITRAKRLIVESLQENKLVEFSDQLSEQEFINTFIQVGVHSIPSMNNLHVHVMTRDFHLERLKNKKHYNSFTSSFFVEWKKLNPENFPSGSESDADSDDGPTNGLERDEKTLALTIKNTPLVCTYCGKNFKNQLKLLKEHLAREFENKFNVKRKVNDRPNP